MHFSGGEYGFQRVHNSSSKKQSFFLKMPVLDSPYSNTGWSLQVVPVLDHRYFPYSTTTVVDHHRGPRDRYGGIVSERPPVM